MGKHERMSAQRAYELGLISEIVEHDRLLERAREIADIVNSNAPLAVRGTRLAILKGLNLPLHEAEMLAETFRERVLRTEDAQEGPKAFVEKRKPNWQMPMSAGFETILLDVDAADHVATITLNRPEQLNAFNRTMCEEMAEAWRTVKLDESVHAVVLRAAGTRAFSAGLDIKTPYGQPENIWNHEDPGEAAQPQVAEDVEAGGVRRSGHVHRGRVLLRQRIRRRHLLDGRNVFRLARVGRPGLRAGADRADAPHRSGRDTADRADGQRRTGRRRHRAADRPGVRGGRPATGCGPAPTRSRRRSPPNRRRRPRAP